MKEFEQFNKKYEMNKERKKQKKGSIACDDGLETDES